jgi:hypothetical protein
MTTTATQVWGAIGIGMMFIVGVAVLAEIVAPPPSSEPSAESLAARATSGQMVRSAGYDCKTVDEVHRYIFSEGFSVYCDHYRYRFEIENRGGRWSVKST